MPSRRSLEAQRLSVEALPDPWRDYPAPASLKWLGEAWVQEGRTAVLEMPSALVPGELCAVLNPRFPQFAERVQVALVRPFQFDPRLWKLKR